MITPRDRLILRTVREAGQTSRARLIQQTGLSGVAIFRGTTDLAARGLLEIGASVVEGRGQPSNLVRLKPNARIVLGVSIMHDQVEATLLDFAGAVLAAQTITLPGVPRDDTLHAIRRFLDETLQARDIPHERVIGVGIALAGFFVNAPNAINPAAGLDDWALIDLRAAIEPILGLPVAIENIANAAAMGERLLGWGKTYGNFAYLNFAHGLGAGLVANNTLLRGNQGNAGEIGGLFEAASLPAPNLNSLRQALEAHGLAFDNIMDLVRRFDLEWPGVADWLDAHRGAIVFLAHALRYTLDCEAIVLGGLIPQALAERMIAQIVWNDDTIPPRRGVGWTLPHLLTAQVRDHAAAVGVASLLLARDYFD